MYVCKCQMKLERNKGSLGVSKSVNGKWERLMRSEETPENGWGKTPVEINPGKAPRGPPKRRPQKETKI